MFDFYKFHYYFLSTISFVGMYESNIISEHFFHQICKKIKKTLTIFKSTIKVLYSYFNWIFLLFWVVFLHKNINPNSSNNFFVIKFEKFRFCGKPKYRWNIAILFNYTKLQYNFHNFVLLIGSSIKSPTVLPSKSFVKYSRRLMLHVIYFDHVMKFNK